MSEHPVPAMTGIQHISLTVSDVEASLAWYQRLLGADRVPMKFGSSDSSVGRLLM
jgi:glyoxylase I family protein